MKTCDRRNIGKVAVRRVYSIIRKNGIVMLSD